MPHQWRFPCEIVDNYDGDTLTLNLHLGFNLSLVVTVRLDNVDTPELRGGTDLTKAAAAYARDEVARFLSGKELVYISTDWAGKYGRSVGRIEANGADLARHLLNNRLGVEYSGGNRAEIQARHQANAEWLASRGLI